MSNAPLDKDAVISSLNSNISNANEILTEFPFSISGMYKTPTPDPPKPTQQTTTVRDLFILDA
jgi:hypothetical protein